MIRTLPAVFAHLLSPVRILPAPEHCLWFAALFLAPAAIGATTYSVTSLNDSGSGSLRAAITLANANPGSIVDASGLTGTINLASELPSIAVSMTIKGPANPALLTLSGGDSHGILL